MAKKSTAKKTTTSEVVVPSPYYTHVDLNKLLPIDVAEKYQVTEKIGKRTSTRIVTAFGTIDFRNLTIPAASKLVKRNCPFIIEKK